MRRSGPEGVAAVDHPPPSLSSVLKNNPLYGDLSLEEAMEERKKHPSWTVEEYDRHSLHTNLSGHLKVLKPKNHFLQLMKKFCQIFLFKKKWILRWQVLFTRPRSLELRSFWLLAFLSPMDLFLVLLCQQLLSSLWCREKEMMRHRKIYLEG